MPYGPAILLLGIYLKKKKKRKEMLIWKDRCIPMSISALLQ